MQARLRYLQRDRVAIQADCAATAAATYWEFERQALRAVDSSGLQNGLNRLRTKGSRVRILPGTPVIHEAGHFAELPFLHEAEGVREAPVAGGNDQFVPVEFDLVHEQPQLGFAQA